MTPEYCASLTNDYDATSRHVRNIEDSDDENLFSEILGSTSEVMQHVAEVTSLNQTINSLKQTIDCLREEANIRNDLISIPNLNQLGSMFASGLQESLKMNATNADLYDLPKLRAYTNKSFLLKQNTDSETPGECLSSYHIVLAILFLIPSLYCLIFNFNLLTSHRRFIFHKFHVPSP